MSVTIGLLADHPEHLAQLAAAYAREWPNWYGVHADAMTDLCDRSRRTGLPVGLIALEDGTVIGALAIAAKSAPSHPQLSPWIIAFWVEPSRRNHGIGGQLLSAACDHASVQGIARLYASTAAASSLFAREGWTLIDTGATDLGTKTNIFARTLAR